MNLSAIIRRYSPLQRINLFLWSLWLFVLSACLLVSSPLIVLWSLVDAITASEFVSGAVDYIRGEIKSGRETKRLLGRRHL
jgi:hypothetical protein